MVNVTATAMVLEAPGTLLRERQLAMAAPAADEVLLQVAACAVCRTDLHLVDGELPDLNPPRVPGHEIVGRVLAMGAAVRELRLGQRVGVPWLGETCGRCEHCRRNEENLCDHARFTGYHRDGGYATHCLAKADYVLPLPDVYGDAEAAPLLCAGLIGYRCLRKCPADAHRIGLYGFGAAGHVVAQVARWEGRQIYAYTRPGDLVAQRFALGLGARWAGDSTATAPVPLDAAIIFAPDGALVPQALAAVRKGGTVVCGGIHMSDIPGFPYARIWGERRLVSVANLTRQDGREFLALAPQIPIRTEVTCYPLAQANAALDDLRAGRVTGAAVLMMANAG